MTIAATPQVEWNPSLRDSASADEVVQKIKDRSECNVEFNVMPDRSVREALRIREFRIGPNWIEAEFDRSYDSDMLNSPSHLTFVSALIQMQKVTYVYACHRFGFSVDVFQPEALKIWPTDVRVTMPGLVRDEKYLVHRMDFIGFRQVGVHAHFATATSRIGVLCIEGSAMIQLLRQPCLRA